MSWMPERVGSTAMRASELPVMEAMTGQAIPGGPSTRIHRAPRASAILRASLRTVDTSLPEFSAPIPSCA